MDGKKRRTATASLGSASAWLRCCCCCGRVWMRALLSACKRLRFKGDGEGKVSGRRRNNFWFRRWFPWALDEAPLSPCAVCPPRLGSGRSRARPTTGFTQADEFPPVMPNATSSPRTAESKTQEGRCCLQECGVLPATPTPCSVLGCGEARHTQPPAPLRLQLLSPGPGLREAAISPPSPMAGVGSASQAAGRQNAL